MGTTWFSGGQALINGSLVRSDIAVADGVIVDTAVRSAATHGARVVDCADLIVAPGFIDLQCNGANGVDITNEPHRIADVAAELARFGVTAFLPTVVTSPAATRTAAIDDITGQTADVTAAAAVGLHLEGPMISRDHLGAHVGRYTAGPADLLDEVDTWVSSGAVAMVTVAPELDRATDVIERLRDAGVVVSAGHTGMTPSDFAAARSAGVSYVTHLFNAMAPFSHRAPGPIGAVLADPTVTVGIICDGIHVDPVAVEMAWRSLGPQRMSLVSDASPALGAPYGRFQLGGFEVIHDETGVRTVDGVLAGSTLPLDRAVRNLIEFTGCSLADAVATVTTTPADLLGLTDRGRLAVGARADLTIIDRAGHLHRTVIAGETAWKS